MDYIKYFNHGKKAMYSVFFGIPLLISIFLIIVSFRYPQEGSTTNFFSYILVFIILNLFFSPFYLLGHFVLIKKLDVEKKSFEYIKYKALKEVSNEIKYEIESTQNRFNFNFYTKVGFSTNCVYLVSLYRNLLTHKKIKMTLNSENLHKTIIKKDFIKKIEFIQIKDKYLFKMSAFVGLLADNGFSIEDIGNFDIFSLRTLISRDVESIDKDGVITIEFQVSKEEFIKNSKLSNFY